MPSQISKGYWPSTASKSLSLPSTYTFYPVINSLNKGSAIHFSSFSCSPSMSKLPFPSREIIATQLYVCNTITFTCTYYYIYMYIPSYALRMLSQTNWYWNCGEKENIKINKKSSVITRKNLGSELQFLKKMIKAQERKENVTKIICNPPNIHLSHPVIWCRVSWVSRKWSIPV